MKSVKKIGFSLIVPFVDRIQLVRELIQGYRVQSTGKNHYSELILVYDGSISDLTNISRDLEISEETDIRLIATNANAGPGPARNIGIQNSTMDYLFFLDSDDLLSVNALDLIAKELISHSFGIEVLSFNWRLNSEAEEKKLPRRDYRWLSDSCLAFEQYLKHHMEGSCIFSVYSAQFVKTNELFFSNGIHEDILFHAKSLFLARHISYLDRIIYIKRDFHDGLTSTWNEGRIDHYLGAYQSVVNLAMNTHHCGKTHDEFIEMTIASAIASICLKLSLHDFEVSFPLLQYIRSSWYKQFYKNLLPGKTVYSQVLELLYSLDASTPERLHKLKDYSLSCKDLHRSVYLAPNEIRTCCKRFFVDGEMKGDVAVISISDVNEDVRATISATDLRLAKRDLYIDMNYGEKTDCDGCPFIELSNWDRFESTLDIQLLSMEQHSVCNLRCTYCDETYYGGLRAKYDVNNLLQNLSAVGALDNLELVVWGGGEPVLDPMFNNYVETVNKKSKSIVNRFLSNSLRFSESIANEIEKGSGLLVTSIDAGSEKIFKKVRGRAGFEKVWGNLQKYSSIDSSRVTIKYIFTEGNQTQLELEDFLSNIVDRKLEGCFFQISSDFKDEVLNLDTIEMALFLYYRLNELGCRFVYLDDLIWQRWDPKTRNFAWDTKFEILGDKLQTKILANPALEERIIFWGANQLTKLLLSNPEFRKRWKITGIVDSNPETWDSNISGIRISSPESIKDLNCKIFLSGVQSIHKLYYSISEYGFSYEQLLRKILW